MSDKIEIRNEWNGKQPIRDPDAEYRENLMYIEYQQKRVEAYFESVKLVEGFLRNDYAEIEKVYHHEDRPIAVKGYLPLGCLRIKEEKRKNEKAVI